MTKLLPVILSALACGCSSSPDDLFGAQGDGATGASADAGGAADGGGSNGPRGAVNLEIYAQPERDCPAGNVHVDVGNSTASPPVLVADGEGGAHVACTIAVDGDKYSVTGKIVDGPRSFEVDQLVTDGSGAVGRVRVADPASETPYESTKDHTCLFQFAAGDGQGVDAKQIYVGFDCSELQSTEDHKKACSSRYGKLRFEGCTPR